MTHGWAVLWLSVPNLLLCLAVLLVLRRQMRSHNNALARLDALKRSLDALDPDAPLDHTPPCQPKHDPVTDVQTQGRPKMFDPHSRDTILGPARLSPLVRPPKRR